MADERGRDAEGGGQKERPEDLFEDLDRFFASMDDTTWSEGEELPEPPRPQEPPAAQQEGPVEHVTAEVPTAAAPPPASQPPPVPREPAEPVDELLPQEWAPQEQAPAQSEGRPEDLPAPPSGPPPATPPTEGGPTAEMSSSDWSRLRDVLGDATEDDEDQFEFLPSTELPPEDVWLDDDEDRLAPPPEEEAGQLTVDDLKKAPPEYQELPVAEEPTVDDIFGPPVEAEAAAPTQPPATGWERPDPAAGGEARPPDVFAGETFALDEPLAPSGAAGDDLLAGLERPQPRTVRVREPEELTGPTWEEPSSRPIMGDPDAEDRPAGRNLPAALASGFLLVVVGLILLALSATAFAVLVGAIVLLAQAELYGTFKRKGFQPATALGLVTGAFVLASAYVKGEAGMAFMLVLGTMLSFLWYMVAAPKARAGAVGNIGVTLLGLLYVPFLASFVLLILAQRTSGRGLTLAILGLTFLYDVAAYGFGSLWGSRPLAPTISPRKSWEGLLGATVVTFGVAIAALPSIQPLTLGRSVIIALVISVFAPLGDLAESLLKRELGVKDMGSILPGHGGALDRIDSALFVVPAVWYLMRLLFVG